MNDNDSDNSALPDNLGRAPSIAVETQHSEVNIDRPPGFLKRLAEKWAAGFIYALYWIGVNIKPKDEIYSAIYGGLVVLATGVIGSLIAAFIIWLIPCSTKSSCDTLTSSAPAISIKTTSTCCLEKKHSGTFRINSGEKYSATSDAKSSIGIFPMIIHSRYTDHVPVRILKRTLGQSCFRKFGDGHRIYPSYYLFSSSPSFSKTLNVKPADSA